MTDIIRGPFYDNGQSVVAKTMKSLSDSMFGNEARQELIRQNALRTGQKVRGAQGASDAYRSNNQVEQGAQSLLYDPTYTGMGKQNLARQALVPGMTADDPSMDVRRIGAGGSAAGTFQGERENIAQRRYSADQATARAAASADAASRRAAETQLSIDARTLTPMRDDNGNIQMVPKSDVIRYRGMGWNASEDPNNQSTNRTHIATNAATNTQSGMNNTATNAERRATSLETTDRTIAAEDMRSQRAADRDQRNLVEHPTTDRVMADIIRASLPPAPGGPATVPASTPGLPPNETPQPASAQQPAPQQAPPAAPPGVPRNPFAHLPIELQHKLGVLVQQKPYVDVATGRVGLSDGQRVYLPDGSIIPLQGTGFVPATDSQHSAMVQAQGNRAEAANPLPAPGAPTQAAHDAAKTSGLKSIVQDELNTTSGFFGGPEIGADTNRGRENLNLLVQRTRQLGAASGSRDSVQREKWMAELAPKPGMLGMTGANPAEQANKVSSLTGSLRQEYAQLQAEATNPNTPPADVQKIAVRLRALRQLIQDWEKPTTPKPAAASAAPPPRAANTKVINGQTYFMLDGKWMMQ